MTTYAEVPLPRWPGPDGDPRAVAASITGWVTSRPMRDLVDCFDERWPRGGTAEVLAGLDEISARRWDFRRGKERHSLTRHEFDPATHERIRAVAGALGLMHGVVPIYDAYDHVLILGGMLRGCVVRARSAARLVRSAVRAGEVCGLGSFRPTVEAETLLAEQLGFGPCPDEFSAMDAAIRDAFGPTGPAHIDGHADPRDPNTSYLVTRYAEADGVRVGVIAAPSSEPQLRRANTADTYRFWAERVARPEPRQRVLLVTGQLYVPFQHCDAVRVLGLAYGCSVDTVGVDPTDPVDEHLRHEWTSENLLQELRSAVRSMRALYERVQA